MKTKDEAKAIEEAFEVHFQELVPNSGPAGTVEGEVVRALMKIAYRDYNDGDKFWRGYGTETAGPAAAFLTSNECPVQEELKPILRSAVGNLDDSYYTNVLHQAMEVVNNHIDKLEGNLTPNTESLDMLNYESEYMDEEEEEDDDDYYDDEDEY